ncbi:dihydropteroate synthase [Lentzea albidocapillata subsp. violacea]|uniref:Dihydropteroate synthase n=2 Tax=Lentzea albidocapillata TaxID=40571 RepID=A0A1G9FXS8_9PSEU|nr:dihydropteroate synthase [Lentzea albidocapillata subsp. violacea]
MADGADIVEFAGELDLPSLTGTVEVVTIPAGDEDFTLAAATVAAMSGARAVRASDVRQARKVVEMVASVRGTRPPARAMRALA